MPIQPSNAARITLGTRPGAAKVERIEDAQRWLSQALPYEVVCKKLAEKYGITTRSAEEYIKKARAAWLARPPMDIEARRIEHANTLQFFYQECMSKGAYASAGRAVRELGLLWGIYPTTGWSHTSNLGSNGAPDTVDIENTDPDRIRGRMAELMDKHAASLAALRASKP